MADQRPFSSRRGNRCIRQVECSIVKEDYNSYVLADGLRHLCHIGRPSDYVR